MFRSFFGRIENSRFFFEIYWPLVRYEGRQNAFKLFLVTLWLNYKYFLQHLLCSFPPKNASHSFVRLCKTSKVSITHILLFEFSKRSQFVFSVCKLQIYVYSEIWDAVKNCTLGGIIENRTEGSSAKFSVFWPFGQFYLFFAFDVRFFSIFSGQN